MIITNVCLLLEALSIVICLHYFYDEKFKFDIVTICFLSLNMIVMTFINYFDMPKTCTMAMYPVIIIYCGIRFGFKLKDIMLNIALGIIYVAVNQIIIMILFYYILGMDGFERINLLIVNLITFISVIVILPHIKWKNFLRFLKVKENISFIVFYTCCGSILFWMISYKKVKILELDHAILLLVSVLFIFVLAGQLNRYKIKAKEIETELILQEMYSESFKGLIESIRLKQHEFDNHINTIYSLHYSCCTYEELVKAQKNYCEQIIRNNRFNKLLAQDNAVIRGFLYAKFNEIDRKGIDVDYQVALDKFDIQIPIYKVVEILGDLINNAVEALEMDNDRNKLYVEIVRADIFIIEVRNESPYIEFDVLKSFFRKDFSKKGENRGLGLYNVKQICEEYSLDLSPKWTEINGRGWLIFRVQKELS